MPVTPKNGETSNGKARVRKTSLTKIMAAAGQHMDPFYTPKELKRNVAQLEDVGEFDALNESRILVLYTGGTIGMKNIGGVYNPAPNYLVQELRKLNIFHDAEYNIQAGSDVEEDRLPLVMPMSAEGKRILYTVWEYDPLLDSCNITMTDWAKLAYDIKKCYHQFDGFVILHGTDTMAYTASALSFMLENLGKTVILTGSQIPIFETRSDGRDNFLGALVLAGNYCIPEVTVYFHDKLLRGNRTTKIDSGSFDAFHSPNFTPLVELEININVNWASIHTQTELTKFDIHTNMSPNVAVLTLFPSITALTVRSFLQPPMEGVVLQTYGAGNGPDARLDLLSLFREASDRGVLLVNTTQCTRGSVSMTYATGEALSKAGILPGGDMTAEAALTKLSYVLGKTELSLDEKKKMMTSNIRGEMRVFGGDSHQDYKKKPREEIPLVERLQEALNITSEEESEQLRLKVYPSLMCSAAVEGNLEALKQLKAAGALFNQGDSDKRTPLHVAASEGNLDVVRYLLRAGSPVHARDRYGHTALDDAVTFNHHATIRLLVQTGAHLNTMPNRLGTQLCQAAMQDDDSSLMSLYLAGANLGQEDYDGRTALHVAVAHQILINIQFLVDKRVRSDIRDNFGLTAQDEAERRGLTDVLTMLRQPLCSHPKPIRGCCKQDDKQNASIHNNCNGITNGDTSTNHAE